MTQNANDPVETTVQELVDIYDEHARSVGLVQRVANGATRALATPLALCIIFALVILWVAGNLLARLAGFHRFEGFPFPDLAFLATIVALLATLLILTTQRHEAIVEQRRDRLTLQIALLAEKKIAKVIALLEEQRRDNPMLQSRIDHEAEAMASATDPRESLEQLERSQQARSGQH